MNARKVLKPPLNTAGPIFLEEKKNQFQSQKYDYSKNIHHTLKFVAFFHVEIQIAVIQKQLQHEQHNPELVQETESDKLKLPVQLSNP